MDISPRYLYKIYNTNIKDNKAQNPPPKDYLSIKHSIVNQDIMCAHDYMVCEGTYVYVHPIIDSSKIKGAKWKQCVHCGLRKITPKLINELNTDIKTKIQEYLTQRVVRSVNSTDTTKTFSRVFIPFEKFEHSLKLSKRSNVSLEYVNQHIFNCVINDTTVYLTQSVDMFLQELLIKNKVFPTGLFCLKQMK